MTTLSVTKLSKDMLDAAKQSLGTDWPVMKEYARAEAKKTAYTLAMISKLVAEGALTGEQAKVHLRMQRNASLAVLLTIEGLGLLAAENAVNAALGAVRSAVNTAVGFVLI